MKSKEIAGNPHHVLLLPYPRQGHINPMLQFAKYFAHKGLQATLILHTSLTKSINQLGLLDPITIQPISDGYDDQNHDRGKDSQQAYLDRFEAVGSQALAELIERLDGVICLVYDAILPWALDVAKRLGLAGAAFLTQPCLVDAVYYGVHQGLLTVPVVGSNYELLKLLGLGVSDLPSFVSVPEYSPAHLRLFVKQFGNIEGADWVLCNTFHELESEVINWMAKFMPMRAIGPMIPSTYLGKHLEGDESYGVDLWTPDDGACMNWLNTREVDSVVYVSFGSISTLSPEQMEELALGLRESNHYFLWVVREVEKDKLPNKFVEDIEEKGLIIGWSHQLEVLAHHAVACFLTHCGWNSTLEAICLGVPMVAMPQWTEQPTNAKCVADVWRVGVRARVDEGGIVRRDEIVRCIKEVMEGERSEEIKGNARKWRELAIKALDEDGHSNKNIQDFVDGVVAK